MTKYRYEGVHAFQEDTGTLWSGSADPGEPVQITAIATHEARQRVREMAARKPVVWFVDDERGNREWFRDYHRRHFAVITFSTQPYAAKGLETDIPCDAVVTDIFFPAKPVVTDQHANRLLQIYDEINLTPTGELNAQEAKWYGHYLRWKPG